MDSMIWQNRETNMGNTGKRKVNLYCSEVIQTFAMLSMVNSFMFACVQWWRNDTNSKMSGVSGIKVTDGAEEGGQKDREQEIIERLCEDRQVGVRGVT